MKLLSLFLLPWLSAFTYNSWTDQTTPKRKLPIAALSSNSACIIWDERVRVIVGSALNSEKSKLPLFLLATPDRIQKNLVSEDLYAKARVNGVVRIIVQLRIPPGPEESRGDRILAVQQKLLAGLPPQTYQVVRIYTAIPAIVLEASEEALKILDQSMHILQVDEDSRAAPSIKPGSFNSNDRNAEG